MSKHIVFIISALSLFVACVEQTVNEEFAAPEIVSATAEPGIHEAHLVCKLSKPRIDSCGIAYSRAGETFTKVSVDVEGDTFQLSLDGLTPGATYEWFAYAWAGEEELRSNKSSFTQDPIPVEERVEIGDAAFKAYLVENFDTDGDGEISIDEAAAVTAITLSTDTVSSLAGIEAFVNLETLDCRGGYNGTPGLLTELDLSSNVNLRSLNCSGNLIKELDVSMLPLLEILICSPMDDASGNNVLEAIWLDILQDIEGITSNRNEGCVPAETEVNCVQSNVEAIDLGLSVLWASCNLGAEERYDLGDFYAWGETEPKTNYDWSTYKWCEGTSTSLTKYNTDPNYGIVDNKTVLDPEDDAARVKWGGKWRMPTMEEVRELNNDDNCEWAMLNDNGVLGFLVRGKKPGYIDNEIFLPMSGVYRCSTLVETNETGIYWASCISDQDHSKSMYIFSYDYHSGLGRDARRWGVSIRPVCDRD